MTQTTPVTFMALLTRAILPLGLWLTVLFGWVVPQWQAWQILTEANYQLAQSQQAALAQVPVEATIARQENCSAHLCWQGSQQSLLQHWQQVAAQPLPLMAMELSPVSSNDWQLKVWLP